MTEVFIWILVSLSILFFGCSCYLYYKNKELKFSIDKYIEINESLLFTVKFAKMDMSTLQYIFYNIYDEYKKGGITKQFKVYIRKLDNIRYKNIMNKPEIKEYNGKRQNY